MTVVFRCDTTGCLHETYHAGGYAEVQVVDAEGNVETLGHVCELYLEEIAARFGGDDPEPPPAEPTPDEAVTS